MATTMFIDLRATPNYKLSKDADRTVYVYQSSGQTNEGYSGSGDSLASMRQEILDDLDAAREAIFSDIRGEDKGTTSFTMLAVSPVQLTKYDNLIAQAARTKDPARKAEIEYIASLEYTYAYAMRDAQQQVNNAVNAGSEWVLGDSAYVAAKIKRAMMADKAAQAYNDALPLGSNWPRKTLGYYGA